MSERVPEGWGISKLEDHLYRPLAYGVLKPDSFVDDGVPMLRIQDVSISGLNRRKLHKISEKLHQEFKRTQLKEGDLVISLVGTIGRVLEIPKSLDGANVSRAFGVIGLSDDINRDYIKQFLTSQKTQDWIQEQAQGNAQKVLNLGELRNLSIVSPPLSEQKKIASILTSVDEVIETTQKQIDKLQDLKKATMNELLTKGIGQTEFKDSELGRIPKSWEVLTVSDYVDVGRGYAFKTADFSNSGNPIIRVTNISAGNRLDLSKNVFYLDCDRSDEFKKFRLKDEDFLLVMVGATVGKYALVETFGKEVFLNQNMWRLRVRDQKRHEQKYAGYALQMVVDRFLKTSQGSARDFLTQKEFGSALVATPKLEEQRKVQEILDIIVAQQRNLSIKLSQTQSLKKSLMQDLLTGKVRVQVN